MPRYPGKGDIADMAETHKNLSTRITCTLVNNTKETWNWEDFRLQSNTLFRDMPVRVIKPGESRTLKLRTSKNNITCEAWIFFTTEKGKMGLQLTNPMWTRAEFKVLDSPTGYRSERTYPKPEFLYTGKHEQPTWTIST